MDVAEWLRGLGLERYASGFRDNDIDGEVLRRLTAEDLREIVGAYHRCVADTVGRFDGFVAKYMGDGVLIYFGYPEAHEDDAERAVRAGLAVIGAIGELATPEPLKVRVSIASGLVVVGDLIGAGALSICAAGSRSAGASATARPGCCGCCGHWICRTARPGRAIRKPTRRHSKPSKRGLCSPPERDRPGAPRDRAV